jgi:trigger factor
MTSSEDSDNVSPENLEASPESASPESASPESASPESANPESSSEASASDEKQKLSLEVAVEKSGACKRHIRVTVARPDIDRYVSKAFDELVPKAEVKGFRPGRAPRKLVEHQFRDQMRDQVKGSLLLDSLEQISEEHSFSAISEPDIDLEAVELPDEGPFTFEFDLEVRPEFDMPDWKGLKLEKPVHEVRQEEIDEHLLRVLGKFSKVVPHEGPAETGMFLTANLTFRHEGRELSKCEEIFFRIRPEISFRDGTIENFEQQIAGVKAGETRTLKCSLSDDLENQELRGKEIDCECEVLEVKQQEIPTLTPALLEQFGGIESEEELRELVKRELERRVRYHQNQSIREQITEQLTQGADWELPPDLLKRQSRRELERAVMELQSNGFSAEEIETHANQLRQNVLQSTEVALREHFILERIAEENKIEPEEGDYDLEIAAIAASRNESPRRVRARLEKRGQMDTLRNQIIERKVLEIVTEQAEFTEVPFELPQSRTSPVAHAICGVHEEEIPEAQAAEAESLRQPVDHT